MLQLTNKIDNTVSVTVKAVSINQENFDITKARMISIMPFKGEDCYRRCYGGGAPLY